MSDDQPDRMSAAFVAVADEELNAAYEMGVQDSMLRASPRELDRKPVPPPERAILRDLIKELREWAGHEALNPDTEQRMYRMAARAEARLKELNDED